MEPQVTNATPVTLDYSALEREDNLASHIVRAYGVDGMGLLTVSGVPGLEASRERLLPLSRTFACLAAEKKRPLEHAPSFYSVGWSHGKERLRNGQPDFAKGSFYNNPLHNRPFDDEKVIADHPAFAYPNIWPSDDVPDMEPAFMQLGQLIVHVGKLVAKQCDRYVHSVHRSYPPSKLHDIIATSRVCKGRLLHYFACDAPPVINATADYATWCGWHNDHGSLTGLVAPMYMDEFTGEQVELTDKDAGLYVCTRRGDVVLAHIPADHIAFQIGETAQVHSGGVLVATPHCVRGTQSPGISRETFAVFMEPEWNYPMTVPGDVNPEQAQAAAAVAHLPDGVPPLRNRWGTAACPFSTCNFGTFTNETYKMFYS